MGYLQAFTLGILEGLTEFLPISSTGHLVLFNYFSGLDLSSPVVQTFEIVIQLGAILAVLVFYFRDFLDLNTVKKIAAGALPTLVIAFLLKDYVEKFLTWPKLIAINLLIGGIIIIIVELLYKKRKTYIESISYKNSFWLGVWQALSIMPGVSRSGAVIVSGLIMGHRREDLAKYSFLLAVPVMIAATGYSLLKHREVLLSADNNLSVLAIGFVTSFLVALLAIRLFLPIVRRYSFIPFGIYRIIIGVVLLSFI